MPKITEEEIISIIDQIIIDVDNLDYTAIYEMIEKLADLDSVIVTPLLTGFLSESHRKAEGNAEDDVEFSRLPKPIQKRTYGNNKL